LLSNCCSLCRHDVVNPATGKPHPGIITGDMGRKTTGLDLDNAWVRFDNLRVDKKSLLNKFGDVVADVYVPVAAGIRTMDMIGQRLFTGRVAVAQAALTFSRGGAVQVEFSLPIA
jgi:acyl-CoA oxidase